MIQNLQIPQHVLDSARLSLTEMRVELAIHLYSEGRLSIGKARELAELSLWQFRQLLAARQIDPHYDIDELESDLETLKKLGRL